MATTVVSFRVKPKELAKALEGLFESGLDSSKLGTISSIVRTTFYHGIISLCKNPTEPASQEYFDSINQLLNQGKRTENVSIKNLLKGA